MLSGVVLSCAVVTVWRLVVAWCEAAHRGVVGESWSGAVSEDRNKYGKWRGMQASSLTNRAAAVSVPCASFIALLSSIYCAIATR